MSRLSSIEDVYSSVLVRKPKMSLFNMSHDVKMSMRAGILTPFMCVECMPGDVWRNTSEVLVKAAPLIAPIMDRVNVKIEFWKVYNRMVWPKWQNYINPTSEADESLELPLIKSASQLLCKDSSLWDYLGLPSQNLPFQWPQTNNAPAINALPFLAYQFIWNEFYRDPNLQDEIELPHMFDPFYQGDLLNVYRQNGMGRPQYEMVLQLRKRDWEKDYFTTAQPDVQRGDDVMLNMNLDGYIDVLPGMLRFDKQQDKTAVTPGAALNMSATTINQYGIEGAAVGTTVSGTSYPAEIVGKLNLGNGQGIASGISINDLRELSTLQRYKERLQLIGTRYVDWLLGIWGVRSSDARMQRPIFVGGGRVPLTVGEVLQTSQTTLGAEDGSAQGNQSGNFFALSSTPSFKTRFEEHGYLIGVMSILPRTSYFQGVPRMFQKKDRYDFAIPMFANLGEQEVRLSELYANDYGEVYTNFNKTFGYQQRYAEYKSIPSSIHGEMRSSLDFWHWSRKFDSEPVLGDAFVKSDPSSRIFAVEDSNVDQFYCHIFNHTRALRSLPRVAVPTLR